MDMPLVLMNHSDYHAAYNYSVVFEPKIDTLYMKKWFHFNIPLMYTAIAIYLTIVFGGKLYMRNRKPFDLKWPLATWNLMLCLFAVSGLVRTLPELIYTLREYGFTYSTCTASFMHQPVSAFWFVLFVLSKILELVDTFFIVFRKRRLIFLHWYHHCTVLWLSWTGAAVILAAARYYIVMNYFAHSLVYFYYFLKSLDVEVPVYLAISLTSSQMLQMVVGCYVTASAYFMKKRGIPCDMPDEYVNYVIIIYGSYLILFANYFYQTYISSSSKKKVE